MKGLDANNLCTHGGDMLAYLYNEMTSADRDTFEVHLAECGTCIDDFAELSQSRYPVFEWKQIEFDPLPTPRVVIPFETPSLSWFDQVRTAFSFGPRLAFGRLGAAMVVAILTGYFVLSGTTGTTEVAKEAEPSASPDRVAISIPSPAVVEASPSRIEDPKSTEMPRPVKAAASSRPAEQSSKSKPAQQPKRNVPIPVMSSIDDDEDDSLRLADIFEEIGTGE